jgi:hypothetical protein
MYFLSFLKKLKYFPVYILYITDATLRSVKMDVKRIGRGVKLKIASTGMAQGAAAGT